MWNCGIYMQELTDFPRIIRLRHKTHRRSIIVCSVTHTRLELTLATVYKLPQEELDTEFKKEFPPDPQLGREMDPSARVWKVYRKEATIVDNALLDGWSSTLNILLIFVSRPADLSTSEVTPNRQAFSRQSQQLSLSRVTSNCSPTMLPMLPQRCISSSLPLPATTLRHSICLFRPISRTGLPSRGGSTACGLRASFSRSPSHYYPFLSCNGSGNIVLVTSRRQRARRSGLAGANRTSRR